MNTCNSSPVLSLSRDSVASSIMLLLVPTVILSTAVIAAGPSLVVVTAWLVDPVMFSREDITNTEQIDFA